jgi:hypothetical protein
MMDEILENRLIAQIKSDGLYQTSHGYRPRGGSMKILKGKGNNEKHEPF